MAATSPRMRPLPNASAETIAHVSVYLELCVSTLARSVPAGQTLSATAIDAGGNTSEFSGPRLVRRP